MIYITKQVLTRGIRTVEEGQYRFYRADTIAMKAGERSWEDYFDRRLGEWHSTLEEAREHAEKVREKKLRSLERSLKKVQAMSFENTKPFFKERK